MSAQNADFRRKPQIFADSPLLLEIQAMGGRRKPQIFAVNRRFLQKTAGNRRLGSVTLGASPLARPYLLRFDSFFGPRCWESRGSRFCAAKVLDTHCLGSWPAFWDPCRTSAERFNRRVVVHELFNYSVQVLSSADICGSHQARAQTSLSKCIQVALCAKKTPLLKWCFRGFASRGCKF